MPEPSWETPARLNGLRPKSWKKREGATRTGTMAEMVEIWLNLPDHQKPDCDIGWGPNEKGHYGTMSASTIARYAQRNGLPPAMEARFPNPAAALARMLKIPEPDFRWPNASSFSDGSGTGQHRSAGNR